MATVTKCPKVGSLKQQELGFSVIQRWRICLPMQETLVQALVWGDSTYYRHMCQNYWEPPRTRALQQEKPLLGEVSALPLPCHPAPLAATRESLCSATKTKHGPKIPGVYSITLLEAWSTKFVSAGWNPVLAELEYLWTVWGRNLLPTSLHLLASEGCQQSLISILCLWGHTAFSSSIGIRFPFASPLIRT